MLITVLTYLPIVVAPVAAAALALSLQHLVGTPSTPASGATLPESAAGVPVASTAANPPTWEDLVAHRSVWVTGVVPVGAGIAILLLGLWPFAYLGWAFVRFNDFNGWQRVPPPWFGNPGYFIGLGGIGVVIAVVSLVGVMLVVLVLHALGKCVVWPALCDCARAESDADPKPRRD